jgi:hypothetical protein
MRLSNGPLLLAAAVLVGIGFAGKARAADYAYQQRAPEPAGVACDVGWAGWYTMLPAYWTSVWLGHFAGGEAHYDHNLGKALVTWDDEKRCFPTYQACSAWVGAMRRDLHRPAGYWTCMPLR